MAFAVNGVEQGQLRAGVRAFAADDESGAGRVAVVVDQAGDLADLGSIPRFAGGVDRGYPVAGGENGLPEGFGDGDSDAEPGVRGMVAQAADVGEQAVGAAG